MLLCCIFMYFLCHIFYEFYLRISTSSQAEFSFNTYFPQYCTERNQIPLNKLKYLGRILEISQKHGLYGKHTDFGRGRYVYIWCPLNKNITISSCIFELNMHGYDVIMTDLFCTGVKIEQI